MNILFLNQFQSYSNRTFYSVFWLFYFWSFVEVAASDILRNSSQAASMLPC